MHEPVKYWLYPLANYLGTLSVAEDDVFSSFPVSGVSSFTDTGAI